MAGADNSKAAVLPGAGKEHISKAHAAARRKANAALLKGPPSFHDGRRALPIYDYASRLVEAVRSQSVVVITGETGSGKTTREWPR